MTLHMPVTIAALAFILTAECAFADTILLNTLSRGSYTDAGVFGTGGAGDPNGNYVTGHLDFGLDSNEFRSFFVFDTSGIADPIVSAHLEADAGFWETETTQMLALFDVVSSIDALRKGTGGAEAFADLGTGVPYGGRVFPFADREAFVSVPLNGEALVRIGEAGLFAMGGALTSISGPNQFIFGGTIGDVVRLRVETAATTPEPSSLLLLASGALAEHWRRRRRHDEHAHR
jgi:PEP-CTERM motif-containing protein